MDNKERKLELLEEKIKNMPEFEQKAVCWVINNIEIAEVMSKGRRIPKDKIELLVKSAREKNDYALLGLVLYKETKDEMKAKEKKKKSKSKSNDNTNE